MTTTNKYSRGKIYRLVNDVDNEFYVGSTCQSLAKRKGEHKNEAKYKPNRRVFLHLNQVGWDNVHIVLIENYPCNSIEELKARERFWIEEMNASLNKLVPLRTQKDSKKMYKMQNKDKINDKQKEYYKKNKDKIAQHNEERVKCECGCEVRRDSLTKHKKTTKHKEWLLIQASTSD